MVEREREHLSGRVRRLILALGILVNLGLLFTFKYYDFFLENVNAFFGAHFRLLGLVLPLGISFFTFQQISFLVDSARDPEMPVYSFDTYALFVTFFPQLIAGPIVLHSEMVPQFMDREKRAFNWENFSRGLMAFSFGLAKKVLLADIFAAPVEAGFASVSTLGTGNAALVMLSYTLQIYFDFSGYCDMATGIALLFNIELPVNFNSPYRSLTITEFWDRWHMTLTRFFTKYLYIDLLGGNRKGKLRTYVNILLVFLVSGLWHGANWTFLLWGALHGLASVLNRLFKRVISRWHPAFSWACTFLFVNLAWVLFRADSLSQAAAFFAQLFSMKLTPLFTVSSLDTNLLVKMLPILRLDTSGNRCLADLLYLFFGLFACLNMKNTHERLADFKPTTARALLCSALLLLSVLSFSGVSVFLYWDF